MKKRTLIVFAPVKLALCNIPTNMMFNFNFNGLGTDDFHNRVSTLLSADVTSKHAPPGESGHLQSSASVEKGC